MAVIGLHPMRACAPRTLHFLWGAYLGSEFPTRGLQFGVARVQGLDRTLACLVAGSKSLDCGERDPLAVDSRDQALVFTDAERGVEVLGHGSRTASDNPGSPCNQA
jgi:hypothetical protein